MLLNTDMKCILFTVTLLCVAYADEVRLVDLNPDEAANLIEKKDQSLKYAPLVETNVPAVRFIGNQQQQVVEDVFQANQYHGQDGLGAYIYGYSVPDISKTEKKTRQGDVRGAYNYIAGDGQEIKIEYWDDGNGFHQIDNIPKVPLVQIEDTPEVKAARTEHERLWKEIAERNSHAPEDPNANTNQQAHYQGQASTQYNQPQAYQAPQQQFQAPPQPQTFQAQFPSQPRPVAPQPQPYQAPKPALPQPQQSYQAPQQQSFQPKPYQAPQQQFQAPQQQSFQPKPYQAPQQQFQAPPQPQSFQAQFPQQPQPVAPQPYQAAKPAPQTYQAQASSFPQSQQNYQPQPIQNRNTQNAKSGEEAEENGPPKGFFYDFDYKVGIIKKPGEERSQHQKRSNDPKSVFEQNKKFFEQNYGASSQPKGAFPSYNY